MNRRDFGQWGIELNSHEFAEALAMLLRNWYHHTPVDILEKLAVYETRKAKAVDGDNASQFPIKVCLDSTYHVLGKMLSYDFSAAQYSARWKDFVDEIKEAHFNNEQERSRRSRYGLPYRDFFLRFELYTNPQHAWWLSEQLSGLEPNASVYLRIDNPTPEIGWNWPLKIGFLPDQSSQALLREMGYSRDKCKNRN